MRMAFLCHKLAFDFQNMQKLFQNMQNKNVTGIRGFDI